MEQFDESPGVVEPTAPPTRRESLVPAAAVTAVAVVAVVAAFTAKRAEEVPAPVQPVVAQAAKPAPAQQSDVVHAPPLTTATKAMGGGAACKSCGVVQTVVAVYGGASKKEPRAYQMHIRMDDGTVRTVQQRGGRAAGSRGQIQGGRGRPVS
jgi:hypothetical protein